MAARYIEQLERTKRYFSRFSGINSGVSHSMASPNYDDDVYAFFQNCYHIKDWIKNDPCCSQWRGDVEEFINANDNLRICADLCNGLKHLKLTGPRSTENPQFAGNHISLSIQEGFSQPSGVGISITYRIATASGDMDAFDLASRCVRAWEDYIVAHLA